MAVGCRVDTVHPIDLQGLSETPFTVKNSGSQTVYYKQGAAGSSVTSTNKDGEIAAGKEFIVTQPTWVIAKEPGAQLDFRQPLRATFAESNLRVEEEARINVRAAPFNAVGNGVADDTAAIQAALNAGKEKEVFIPPGKYQITSPLEIPASTNLVGANMRTSILEAEGEIDLIRLTGTGDMQMSSLFLRCKSIQATEGSAIDFSHGFSSNFFGKEIMVGSNFFNGLFIVGKTGTELGLIKFNQIRGVEFNSSLKKIGNAFAVIGSTNSRVNNCGIADCTIQGATAADLPQGFEVNNADSLMLTRTLVQTAVRGLTTGKSDASTKKTTNMMLEQAQFDGCSTDAVELIKCFNATITGCRAEAGGAGIVIGAEATGNNIAGCTLYANNTHGVEVLSSVLATYANTITGNTILNNGQNKEAAMCGILVPEKSGGLVITGNTIGNSPLMATEEQKVGILVNKKAENIVVAGNRLAKNVTANYKLETETVEVTSAAKVKELNIEA